MRCLCKRLAPDVDMTKVIMRCCGRVIEALILWYVLSSWEGDCPDEGYMGPQL